MKSQTKATLRFYLKHVLSYRWIALSMVVIMVLSIGSQMWIPFFYKDFFNVLSGGVDVSILDRTGLYADLIRITLMIFALSTFEWLTWRLSGFINNFLQPKLMANIMNECFAYLHRHSYNFFSNNFAGALVKKVNRIARAFEDVADKIYWSLFPLFLRITIILGVLLWLHTLLGLIILVWTALFLAINYALTIYKLPYDLRASENDTKVTARLADTITNNVNVQLFSAFSFEEKGFYETTKQWFIHTKRAWDIGQTIDAVQGLLMCFLELVTLYYFAKLWSQGVLTLGDFALIQSYLLTIYSQLWDFGRSIRQLYERLADAAEMTVIMQTPHEVKDVVGAARLHVTRGEVEFDRVNFSYKDGVNVIHELSFHVKPSEKIGLIGPSGGGKTTIVKLLLRLFDIQEGAIRIDGQNISEVTLDSLHEQVSLVPQDPILFHRTLMDNIRYGRRDATDEEVIAAAKLAHCHEFIMHFPHGYETYVGERGVKLSGGERQRVAIARAILTNAPILILDEATSSLDSESETLIQAALLNLMKNRTTFVVAHRLSTVMKMDRIFVLQDGCIIEDGGHQELLAAENSLYKKFWDLQVGGYLDGESEGGVEGNDDSEE
jgi:ATP-binding cassette subfamily B protein